MRGLTDRRVIHVKIVADGAHDHFTGIQSDAYLHGGAVGSLHVITVAGNLRLHSQCRIAGAHRMIFQRQRRTKQGHDSIAYDLVDRALVAVHGFHHALEHRVENPSGFLRVAVGE